MRDDVNKNAIGINKKVLPLTPIYQYAEVAPVWTIICCVGNDEPENQASIQMSDELTLEVHNL